MRGSKDADCFYRTPLGEYRVRSRAYLAWLHAELAAGRVKPLIVDGAPPSWGSVELHHFSQRGRANDLLVVPLHHSTHRWLETTPERNVAFQVSPQAFMFACATFADYLTREHLSHRLEAWPPANGGRQLCRSLDMYTDWLDWLSARDEFVTEVMQWRG